MIDGFATIDGTARYASRFEAKHNGDFYNQASGLTLSSLGFGTYLIEPNEKDEKLLEESLAHALESGINVIDTAINYSHQRSERVIGRVIAKLIDKKVIRRDEIFISTKGGFIPFDGDVPKDPNQYFSDRFLKTRILDSKEVVAGCHSLGAKFIDHMFEQSRLNMGLAGIDLYFLHNPETQLEAFSHDELVHRLYRAFLILRHKIQEKKLHFFGLATWNGFRVPKTSKDCLNLKEIVETASDHGECSDFKFIQLPYNMTMKEASTVKGQGLSTIFEKAAELGIYTFTSSSIMQGKLAQTGSAVEALNFARSAPSVVSSLCGMKNISHLKANLGIAKIKKNKF